MKYNLRSLQILEAVYRIGSVAGAAAELGITASAVSHQMRKLSDEVGERLLEKAGRGICLTETGNTLAEKLSIAFSDIDRSVTASIGGGRPVLRIAACSSFGPGWLVRRMGSLQATLAGVDLQFRMYAQDPRLTDAVADGHRKVNFSEAKV